MTAARTGGVPGAMLRPDAVLRRHRRMVLGCWLLAVPAAMPFAAHRSDHLTGGGFTANGSDSAAVRAAVERDHPEVAAAGPEATGRVGGTTANDLDLDLDRLVAGSLEKILPFVLAVSSLVPQHEAAVLVSDRVPVISGDRA